MAFDVGALGGQRELRRRGDAQDEGWGGGGGCEGGDAAGGRERFEGPAEVQRVHAGEDEEQDLDWWGVGSGGGGWRLLFLRHDEMRDDMVRGL